MNTTAFGLMCAIPLLLLHAKLTSTTGQIVDSLEMASVKALNNHFEKKSEFSDGSQQVVIQKPQLGTAP
jgi:biopolymer transport protein ExbB